MTGERRPLTPEESARRSAQVSAQMTPERRARISRQQKARFADQNERAAAAERMRKVWADLRSKDHPGEGDV